MSKQNENEKIIELITSLVIKQMDSTDSNSNKIPVGISARHVHLSRCELDELFGIGYELSVLKPLSQPGQFAAKETVEIIGPKGSFEKVRIIGPIRAQTQIEISLSDARKLAIDAPIRASGDLFNTPSIIIKNSNRFLRTNGGVILPERHIHMTVKDAEIFNVSNNQKVNVLIPGEKGGIFNNVTIRVTDVSSLDFHIDTDESNAFNMFNGQFVEIVK